MIEDLGVQMNLHSTLVSYLNRLVWLLTGHYARPGTNNAFVPLLGLSQSKKDRPSAQKAATAAGSPASPKPMLPEPRDRQPDHHGPRAVQRDPGGNPHRSSRSASAAMLIESANPVHSLADSQRMREAIRALELSVVIDVAMSETAAQADYVLPASSQFEKAEATFFNLEFPRNGFHLRQPLFDPLPGTLPEAEIHARLVEALGELDERHYRPLRRAARLGPMAFALAFAWKAKRDRRFARYAPVVLYRSLGRRLPAGNGAGRMPVGHLPDVRPSAPRSSERGRDSAARPCGPATTCSKRSSDHPRASCLPSATTRTAGEPFRHPGHRINLPYRN